MNTPTGMVEDPFGLAGSVLEGQYRADAVVGEGGFGVVYRGRHLSLDQPIAIKMLKGLDGGDTNINALVLEKFRAEARLLYTLSQSSLHIVRCLDFGATTTPAGVWAPFMILEWLDGQSLADDLVQRRSQGMRGRSVDEVLTILEPVADGLSIAHQQHVAHRDIKPANIFLLHGQNAQGRGGRAAVKVLDFGIAKIMKEGESAGTKGTFASFTWLYAAPEQLDPRIGQTGLETDVYGFGLLLTEMLTDRRPVDERDVISILKAATNPTRRPTPRTKGANVPDDLEAICARALAVDPKARFASIKELWSALATLRDGRKSVHTQAQMAPLSVVAAPSTMTSGFANPMAATGLAPPSNLLPSNVGGMPMSMVAPSVVVSAQPQSPPQQQQPQQQQQQPPLMNASVSPFSNAVSAASPPMGTAPPRTPGVAPPPMQYQQPPPQQHQLPPVNFGAPMQPYQQQGFAPPPGTAPPGGFVRRMPFVRTDGTSPIVWVTIVFFVLALMFAGTCAAVGAACTS